MNECRKCYEGQIVNFLDDLDDLIFLKNEKFEYIFINKPHEELLNIKVEDAVGKTDFDIMDEESAKHCRASDTIALNEGSFISEERVGNRWYNTKKTRVEDENGFRGVFSIIREVTSQKELEFSLSNGMYKDSLTDIYNRHYYTEKFEEKFKELKNENGKLSFALLDIDSFKKINDKYGHLEGDKVLKELSNVIKKSIRKGDIPFRIGGEEFAIMFPDCDVNIARKATNRIKERIRKVRLNYEGEEYGFTFTAGVSEMKKEDQNSSDIFSRADKLLYRGKISGKDKIVA